MGGGVGEGGVRTGLRRSWAEEGLRMVAADSMAWYSGVRRMVKVTRAIERVEGRGEGGLGLRLRARCLLWPCRSSLPFGNPWPERI